MAIVERMSTIFELEEYDFDERDENGEAQVLLDGANYSSTSIP